MKQPKSRKSKLIRNVLLAIMAVSAVVVIMSGIQNRKQNTDSGQPNVALTTDAPQVSAPAMPASSPKKAAKPGKAQADKSNSHPSTYSKAGVVDAVNAAALADVNLTLSQFQTPDVRRQIIDAMVVPLLRAELDKVYAVTGKYIATKFLGYKSVDDFRIACQCYRVVTLMYKVIKMTSNSATISLFDFASFQTRNDMLMNLEHKDVSISVVVMRRVAGQWLLADIRPGPGPQYQVGQDVKFDQKLAAYKPYLRGFIQYGNSSQTG